MNKEIKKLKEELTAEVEKYNQECKKLYNEFYKEKIRKLQKKEAE